MVVVVAEEEGVDGGATPGSGGHCWRYSTTTVDIDFLGQVVVTFGG